MTWLQPTLRNYQMIDPLYAWKSVYNSREQERITCSLCTFNILLMLHTRQGSYLGQTNFLNNNGTRDLLHLRHKIISHIGKYNNIITNNSVGRFTKDVQ